jgi:hypothetical protein
MTTHRCPWCRCLPPGTPLCVGNPAAEFYPLVLEIDRLTYSTRRRYPT